MTILYYTLILIPVLCFAILASGIYLNKKSIVQKDPFEDIEFQESMKRIREKEKKDSFIYGNSVPINMKNLN